MIFGLDIKTKSEERRLQKKREKLEKQASESALSRASYAMTPTPDDTDTKSLSQVLITTGSC